MKKSGATLTLVASRQPERIRRADDNVIPLPRRGLFLLVREQKRLTEGEIRADERRLGTQKVIVAVVALFAVRAAFIHPAAMLALAAADLVLATLMMDWRRRTNPDAWLREFALIPAVEPERVAEYIAPYRNAGWQTSFRDEEDLRQPCVFLPDDANGPNAVLNRAIDRLPPAERECYSPRNFIYVTNPLNS